MHRFFIKQKVINNKITPSKELLHQFKKVLRFTTKDNFIVFDNEREYLCFLNEKDEIVIIKEQEQNQIFKKMPKIVLVQSILKNHKMPLIMQKATELGVDEIILVETKRSISKYINVSLKFSRFEKILIEASEQSKRLSIPELKILKSYNDIDFLNKNNLKILFYENEKENYIFNIKYNFLQYEKIYLFIGPEGGFEKFEVDELANKYDFKILGLHLNILRSETAALAAVSIISNLLFSESAKILNNE